MCFEATFSMTKMVVSVLASASESCRICISALCVLGTLSNPKMVQPVTHNNETLLLHAEDGLLFLFIHL